MRTCAHAFMYMCARVFMRTRARAFMYMCARVFMRTCAHAFMYMCARVFMRTRARAFMCICARVFMHTCARAFMCICARVFMRVCARICTHIRRPLQILCRCVHTRAYMHIYISLHALQRSTWFVSMNVELVREYERGTGSGV
jgi:hypothetical protein